jgi:hypothetical protein
MPLSQEGGGGFGGGFTSGWWGGQRRDDETDEFGCTATAEQGPGKEFCLSESWSAHWAAAACLVRARRKLVA